MIQHRRGFELIQFEKIRPRNEPLDIRAMSVMVVEVLNPQWDALDPANRVATPPDAQKASEPYIPHAHRRPRNRGPRR